MKVYLSRKGIAFTEKDISKDKAALNELLEMGFAATPVTIIDSESVVGFDRKRIDALLGL